MHSLGSPTTPGPHSCGCQWDHPRTAHLQEMGQLPQVHKAVVVSGPDLELGSAPAMKQLKCICLGCVVGQDVIGFVVGQRMTYVRSGLPRE
eukprot:scaffold96239_cov18-Tisochrysis_lutea.AAC.1